MAKSKKKSTLSIRGFGPIEHAELEFGDLTVLVGPQGAGKSLVLQWLKLALDSAEIGKSLVEAGVDLFEISTEQSLDVYFGEGMSQALKKKTQVTFDGRLVRPESIAAGKEAPPRMFYIPAHRALLLADGWPAPFMKLPTGTPVVVRLFSQALYDQLSARGVETLFPLDRVLVKDIRERIDASVFHGATVELRQHGLRQRRLELRFGGKRGLPYMAWTAGQREFTPLLLGLYHVLPPRRETKVAGLDWVVIEEPELGLHPFAITTIMILVMDLLWRGYRVAISTHSPLVLDFVWALRHFKHPKANLKDLGNAIGLHSPSALKKLRAAIDSDMRVYYLEHDEHHRVRSQDISQLRPDAESDAESYWGGLTLFASFLGSAVSRIPEDDS